MKKLLFALAAIVLGFIVFSYTFYADFYATFKSLTANYVKSEQYLDAEEFYSFLIDDTKKYTADSTDGVHVEIFPAINDCVVYTFKEDGTTDSYYYARRSVISLAIFNAKITASTETAGINFNTSSGAVFVPFIEKQGENEINYTTYAEYYNFIPMAVSYEKLLEQFSVTDATSITINSVEIVNDEGNVLYTFTFNQAVSFNNDLHNTYYADLAEYNLYQSDVNDKIENKETLKTALAEKLAGYNTNNRFAEQKSVSIVYSSAKFIWIMVAVVVVYLALIVFLTIFLFFKKPGKKAPAKFVPHNQQQTQQAQTQQFTRDDLFGENGQFNENQTEEPGQTNDELIDELLAADEIVADDLEENE